MAKNVKLSRSMTEVQFDNGYWYTAELKDFAKEIRIPSFSKLRKDELEDSIKHFLHTGKVKNPTKRKAYKNWSKRCQNRTKSQINYY